MMYDRLLMILIDHRKIGRKDKPSRHSTLPKLRENKRLQLYLETLAKFACEKMVLAV